MNVDRTWGERVTTVFPRQGKFANAPKLLAAYPNAADVTVDRIGDLLDFDLTDLLVANSQRAESGLSRRTDAGYGSRVLSCGLDSAAAAFHQAIRARQNVTRPRRLSMAGTSLRPNRKERPHASENSSNCP